MNEVSIIGHSSSVNSYAGKWVTGVEKAAYRGGC